MALEQKDIELIERIVYKSGDDVAISAARSFERLEERIDATESRIYARFAEEEDRFGFEIEKCKDDLLDELGLIRENVRGSAHANEQPGDVNRHEA